MTYEEMCAKMDAALGTGRYAVRSYPDETVVFGYRATIREAITLRNSCSGPNRPAIIVDTKTNRLVRR